MDKTQLGSAEMAIDKARTAALFKRPTRAFQDVVAAGRDGSRLLFVKGVVAGAGVVPLAMDVKVVGAVGLTRRNCRCRTRGCICGDSCWCRWRRLPRRRCIRVCNGR